MSWPRKKLSDLLTFLTSGSRGWAKYYADSGALFLRIQNVSGGRVNLDDVAYVQAPDSAEARRTIVQPGDVLLSITADLGRTGVVPDNIGPAHINQHLAILRVEGINPHFLAAYLSSPDGQRQVKRLDRVGVKSGLNFDDVRSLAVPLPPLPEQRRIVAILDKADAIRRKRRETIRLTEEFLRSAFLDMFGDPVTNPKGWPVEDLGGLLEDIQGGWSAKGENRPAEPGERGVLKISAVTTGRFKPEENKAVPKSQIERKVLAPEKGDLLFSRANTRELVAATCLVEEDHPNLFLPDKLWKLIPTPQVAAEFLRFLLADRKYRASIARHATGTSGSMLNVSKEKLRRMIVPVPDNEIQRQFGCLVWKTYTTRYQVESGAAKAGDLFAALVERAFKGELQ